MEDKMLAGELSAPTLKNMAQEMIGVQLGDEESMFYLFILNSLAKGTKSIDIPDEVGPALGFSLRRQ